MKAFDFLVFIGRFQPWHKGHLSVVESALAQAEHVIVLCGSAHQPRSIRNPWSFDERVAMIQGSVIRQDAKRLHIAPLMDSLYNDEAWVKNVQMTVNGIATAYHPYPQRAVKIGLIGHTKDKTSYYLNLFPQWASVAVPNYKGLSSTPIRETLFQKGSIPNDDALPANVDQYIREFVETDPFTVIKDESAFVDQYKRSGIAHPIHRHL
jgi:bifunctional NMN adenylyltransferase/nudix hydrolase